MVDVTLLEVNLEGSQFTAHAPFSGEESSGGKVSRLLGKGGGKGDSENADGDAAASDSDADEAESGGGAGPIAAVVALAVIVVLAVLVRKLRGGPDRESPETLDVETEIETDQAA